MILLATVRVLYNRCYMVSLRSRSESSWLTNSLIGGSIEMDRTVSLLPNEYDFDSYMVRRTFSSRSH